MITGYDLFLRQLDEAIGINKGLYKTNLEGKVILKGIIPIIDSEGKHWEDFDIEIHCSKYFPDRFPLLFETGGKIPRVSDWHVYEDTGSCCLKILPEEILRCLKGINITDYIREEVVPYLFNQTHRRVEGYYVNGEYSHGIIGIAEYYSEILGTGDDVKKMLHLLRYILTNSRPFRTSNCFCGKKSKFRHCHRAAFDKLKSLGDFILKLHYTKIAKAAGFDINL